MTLKPSSALTLYAIGLKEAIQIASKPGTKATVYRPATWDAVNLARKLVREYTAMEGREELRKLLAAVKPVDVCRPDTYKPSNRYIPDWRG